MKGRMKSNPATDKQASQRQTNGSIDTTKTTKQPSS